MKNFAVKLFVCVFCLVWFTESIFAADVNLSVAASLREAVTELSAAFSQKNPGGSLQRNFGSSGALAKQIEHGAPCDVFFSANVEWVDYLKQKKLIDEHNIATFAFNELVFVGKTGLKVGSLQDLFQLEKIAIGSPKSVPAGQYTMEAFKNAGVDKLLEKKLVMARDVRECLMYAKRGEVDGAFVYKTDAAIMAGDVKVLFIVPQEFYSRVIYPVALTVTGSKKTEASAFYKFLQSAEAKKVLSKYGFAVK